MLMCLVLLSMPSFLIGCSLPLFAGYLSRLDSERVFSKAYTVYNFGAVVTALLIEYWLLRSLGIRNTVLVIASINGVVALGLLYGFRELRDLMLPSTPRVRFSKHQVMALAVVSIASAIFQLLMVKLAESIFGPFRETFALVLAVVFLGMAVGSAMTGKLRIGFAVLLVANLIGLAWLLGGFVWMTEWHASLYPIAVERYFTSAGSLVFSGV
jgi:predicted membrane-bound spermidine synthase